MNGSNTRAEIAALREAALEDLMATTDAELQKEALEDGEDVTVLALQIKATMREAAAETLRRRLVDAKGRMQSKSKNFTASFNRPPLEQIKQIIQNLFTIDQSLGLAFREGKKQTDADWLSLYDDLVAMGAIKHDGHGD